MMPELKVWDVTVRVCQDCIDLKGQECHTPECVFCFHGMEEVKWLLDKMLICPIIDGERIVLAGNGVDDQDLCAFCGFKESEPLHDLKYGSHPFRAPEQQEKEAPGEPDDIFGVPV